MLPVPSSELDDLEADVLNILGLDPGLKHQEWAELLPPGVLAYVLRPLDNIAFNNPAIAARAAEMSVLQISLKIYATARGQRQGPCIVGFQQRRVENKRPFQSRTDIQKVLDAGEWQGAEGTSRFWLLQEYVEGRTLEEMLAHVWTAVDVLDRLTARQLLEDLFAILTDIWIAPEEGMEGFFWDIRAANWVVTPQNRLVLIDSDGLKAGREENRAGQRRTGLARLRQRTFEILRAHDRRTRLNVVQAAWRNADMDHLPDHTDLEAARRCVQGYLESLLPSAGARQEG
jgi:hypothetical protein